MRIANCRRRATAVIFGLLLLAVIAIYGQTARHEFVNFDDNEYVYEDPPVLRGFQGGGLGWAFTTRDVSSQWQPLTLLSLMADVAVVRPTDDAADLARLAAWMHAVNVALHAVNALLLFLLLRDMTGAVWRSAVVAAVFAVHPLHVESVAWITERKDMLCGLFGLLALWAYARYARRPSVVRYLAVAAALALGLMCKPMLVTWPLLFLLVDYWPLRRPPRVGLLLEKVPLLALAAASSTMAVLAQHAGGAVISLETSPISARFARAAVVYVAYLGETLWPTNLAVAYPDGAVERPALAAALLALLTAAAAWGVWRGMGFLAVGWFWYLGTLVPTIGLVKVGSAVMADRFVYLPQIGLCVAAVWGGAELAAARPDRRWQIVFGTALLLSGWTACAWRQTAYWRTSERLWTRALASTSRNLVAQYNYANTLKDGGNPSAAIPHYRKALEIDPKFLAAISNMGVALAACDRDGEAIAEYEKALAIKPDSATVYCNLGNLLARRRQYVAAIADFRRALEFWPKDVTTRRNLAIALSEHGEAEAAISEYEKVLEFDPDNPSLYYRLGVELEDHGRRDEAMKRYEKALELADSQRKTSMAEAIRERMARHGASGP
jgi:tetratricopeptide (TPR) repeat protein